MTGHPRILVLALICAEVVHTFRPVTKNKCYRTTRADATQIEKILELRAAQSELHAWGRANQLAFDPNNESFHILHKRMHHGEDF